MILGTAGHIDHGKTSLVRALTGVDTDRLPEEKRRGITIDLGFAPLRLDGIDTIGVVDVPGHEAFVRTMVAGATGVDLALLVIAADEGVMPQTREHLSILRLLGVHAGVVALTKSDLVEEEWIALVRDDVREALVGSSLADAEVIAVSAVNGAGIDELRAALLRAARSVPARRADDLFRMPVDRAFTIRGTGTVATGTVWSGSLARDEVLRLYPSGDVVRVRALQAHGHGVERVSAGERAAVALAGVELSRVDRGAVLVSGDGRWKLQVPHTFRTLAGRAGGTGGIPAKYEQRKLEKPELYDLQADIGEEHDLASSQPEVLQRLLAFAEKTRADLGDQLTKTPATGARLPDRVGPIEKPAKGD